MKTRYFKLLQKYDNQEIHSEKLYEFLKNAYSQKDRYYHNLLHIKKMLDFSKRFSDKIEQYDDLCFAIWYHDIVYNPLSKTNEFDSAKIAINHLNLLNYNNSEYVRHLIERTNSHFVHHKNETKVLKLLLDLDLMSLGSKPEIYDNNTKMIRKEYKIVPDEKFNFGRIKFINNLLEAKFIFRTDYFKNNFEKQAKINLLNELKQLKIGVYCHNLCIREIVV